MLEHWEYGWQSAIVDVLAIADPDDDDSENVVVNVSDDQIVADTILPEFTELRAPEGFAYAAWVFKFGDALKQEFQNSP